MSPGAAPRRAWPVGLAGQVADCVLPQSVSARAGQTAAAGVSAGGELLVRLCGDVGLMPDVIAAFLEDCPARLNAIESAVRGSHADLLRAEAHALKGSAANLSATALFDAAQALARITGTTPVVALEGAGRLVSTVATHLMNVLRDRTAAKEPPSCAF